MELFINLVDMGIRMAIPFILVGAGELITENSGVLNLGLEGMMTIGALTTFITVLFTKSILLGFIAGMLAGGVFGLVLGYSVISLKINQVVAGLAIFFLGIGLSDYIYELVLGIQMVSPTIPRINIINIPLLSQIPVIGRLIFQRTIVFYCSIALMGLVSFILYRTNWGIRIRGTGDDPATIDSLGMSVKRIRYIALLIGSMLAGLGGSYLALELGIFRQWMIAGRGWIVIALVVFAGWRPWVFVGGAFLVGMLDAIRLNATTFFPSIPYRLLMTLPYIVTIVILVLITKGKASPNALAVPFEGEED